MISTYYRLTKPGIIYGNLLPAVAAFFFGSSGSPNLVLFGLSMLGLALIIGCGCVLNNYFDRALDARMERTKNRALANGTMSSVRALVFAALLGIGGVCALYFTTLPALGWALFGLFVYVALYTPLKSRTPLALFVGAVAGAVPPVVGYTAASGVFDGYAAALFAVLYVWQLPHFIAIAYFRFDEYRAAGVPLVVRHSPSADERRIAKKIFHYSLWVLLLGCAGLIVHTWIR